MSFYDELKRKNVIRVAISYVVISWVLIQVGDILFSAMDLGQEPTRIMLVVLFLGFIPALVFAWAFEITPEGIKREKDIERDESITNVTAKKLDKATIGLLVVAIILFGADKIFKDDAADVDPSKTVAASASENIVATADTISEQSIAVLPFVNMSSDVEQDYFSDGITEEILNSLAKIRQLKVAGRTSSFSFKGKNDDLRTIGAALGVAHVLEGSVRKAGAEVRITAQLIKVADGFHMWSETYDGSLEKVFDLQERIAREVTNELKIVMNLGEDTRLVHKLTGSVAAYDLFLRGRELVRKRINNSILEGIALLEQAVVLDPLFAEAWSVLAEAEAIIDGYQPEDAMTVGTERARAHIEKALAIDPSLVLPHAVNGLIKGDIDNDFLGAINELEFALSLDPQNPLTLRWLGNYYQGLGYFDKAQALYESAYALEPLSRVETFNLASNRLHQGELDAAMLLFQKVNELTGLMHADVVAYILDAQGDPEAAADYIAQVVMAGANQQGMDEAAALDAAREYSALAFGRDANAQTSANHFVNTPTNSLWQMAGYIAVGNFDLVYAYLDEKPNLFNEFAADYMWFKLPRFIAFRQDQRFAPMLERFGVIADWNELGWPDHCQPNAGTDGSNGQFRCE